MAGSELRGFVTSEDGAVTVDWVVLTGALVALGLAAGAVVSAGVGDVSNATSEQIADVEVGLPFGGPEATVLTADTLTSWHHNAGWFAGVTAQYSDAGTYSDAALLSQHQAMADTILANRPGDRASGHYQNAIDHMGAIEIGMDARNIDVPDSGITYSEAYAAYHGG